MDGSWTIGELAELAAGALGPGDGPGQGVTRPNGRVRDVPNERLIRWYATVGLVDPPVSRRGRIARYGRRHLLQLVAIKRRQAEGWSLAEIQAELAGATDASLAAVARVPDAVLAARAGGAAARLGGTARDIGPAASAPVAQVPPGAAGASDPAGAAGAQVRPSAAGSPAPAGAAGGQAPACAAGAPTSAARSAPAPGRPAAGTALAAASPAPARFWAQRPEPRTASAQAGPPGDGGPQAAVPDAGRGAVSGGQDQPRLVCGIWLAPGVSVLLDRAERAPDTGDLAVISAAAGPLLQVLASLGLSPQDGSTSPAASPPGNPPDDPDGQERSRT